MKWRLIDFSELTEPAGNLSKVWKESLQMVASSALRWFRHGMTRSLNSSLLWGTTNEIRVALWRSISQKMLVMAGISHSRRSSRSFTFSQTPGVPQSTFLQCEQTWANVQGNACDRRGGISTGISESAQYRKNAQRSSRGIFFKGEIAPRRFSISSIFFPGGVGSSLDGSGPTDFIVDISIFSNSTSLLVWERRLRIRFCISSVNAPLDLHASNSVSFKFMSGWRWPSHLPSHGIPGIQVCSENAVIEE